MDCEYRGSVRFCFHGGSVKCEYTAYISFSSFLFILLPIFISSSLNSSPFCYPPLSLPLFLSPSFFLFLSFPLFHSFSFLHLFHYFYSSHSTVFSSSLSISNPSSLLTPPTSFFFISQTLLPNLSFTISPSVSFSFSYFLSLSSCHAAYFFLAPL